jgi:hypothetical protein
MSLTYVSSKESDPIAGFPTIVQPPRRGELQDDENNSCSAYEPGPRNADLDAAVGIVWEELLGRAMTKATAYMGVLFCFGCGFVFLTPPPSG